MDADLSLILGPIVLAVVFNVRPVHLAPPSLLAYTLSTGGRVRNVYHPVVQLLYFRVQGSVVHPVRALSRCQAEEVLTNLPRLLVGWVFFLDTFHTAAATYMLWEFVVPNFGNPEIFLHLPW